MRSILKCLVILFGFIFGAVSAQVPIEWIRLFNTDNQEGFWDIYATSDGGFIMCGGAQNDNFGWPAFGQIFVVKTDSEGEEEWRTLLESFESRSTARSLIETDNREYVVAGEINGNVDRAAAWCLSADGELIWRSTFDPYLFSAVIELKDGSLMFSGREFLVLTESDGDEVWSRGYNPGAYAGLSSLRETEGGVVATGSGSRYQGDLHYYAVKVSLRDGDPIWTHLYTDIDWSRSTGMTSTGDGGFLLAGHIGYGSETDASWAKINGNGEMLWHRVLEREGRDQLSGIVRLSDHGFAMVGHSYYSRYNTHPTVIRINRSGELIWSEEYEFEEDERFGRDAATAFFSVAVNNRSEIVACGIVPSAADEGRADAFIMKLESDILNSDYLIITPEDTVLWVFPDTTIIFSVQPRGDRFNDLEFLWTLDDSVVARLDSCIIEFDEVGDYSVLCRVTANEWTVPIHWTVHVRDLFISSHQPDALELTVRRNESVDFSVEVEAVDGDPINYEWTFDREIISNEPTTHIQFRESGVHPVHIAAFRDAAADSLEWLVHVRSTVRDFWPDEPAIRAAVDTSILFGVEPFDPGEEEMMMIMMMNGDTLAVDTSEVWVNFEEVGEYDIRYIVWIGEEADTIRWEVTIYDPLGVDRQAGTPAPLEFGLLPPAPNPFNSSVTLSFTLPQPSHIRLVVFDISGRIVEELAGGQYGRGEHDVIWNAGGVPAGIYFARLATEGFTDVKKIMLIR